MTKTSIAVSESLTLHQHIVAWVADMEMTARWDTKTTGRALAILSLFAHIMTMVGASRISEVRPAHINIYRIILRHVPQRYSKRGDVTYLALDYLTGPTWALAPITQRRHLQILKRYMQAAAVSGLLHDELVSFEDFGGHPARINTQSGD